MLASITPQEELAYVLPALIANAHMENGRNPGILDVEALSPELATEMRKFGHDELSVDLLKAFARAGDVVVLAEGEMRLFDGCVVSEFAGV